MSNAAREPKKVEANVEPLFGVSALPAGVDDDVSDLMGDLTDQMRRGEISALAVVVVRPNRDVEHLWAAGNAPHNLLMAGAARLQYRLCAIVAEED